MLKNAGKQPSESQSDATAMDFAFLAQAAKALKSAPQSPATDRHDLTQS